MIYELTSFDDYGLLLELCEQNCSCLKSHVILCTNWISLLACKIFKDYQIPFVKLFFVDPNPQRINISGNTLYKNSKCHSLEHFLVWKDVKKGQNQHRCCEVVIFKE